jgi:uncharacterized membrane protein
MAERSSGRREERAVQRLLRGGLIVSSLLLAAGLGWTLATGTLQAHPVSFRGLTHSLGSGHPGGIMALGLMVLLALPVVRVIVLAIDFARARDWRYAAVASIVLMLLVLAVFLGRI